MSVLFDQLNALNNQLSAKMQPLQDRKQAITQELIAIDFVLAKLDTQQQRLSITMDIVEEIEAESAPPQEPV